MTKRIKASKHEHRTKEHVKRPPYDRSNDPIGEPCHSSFFWNRYCYENKGGSGWAENYDLDRNRPRSNHGGDVVGVDITIEVDMSFASAGGSTSDISDCCYVLFGYPHNPIYGYAIDGNMSQLKNSINHVNDKNQVGDEWTALHGAVFYNQLSAVEYLLKHGADYTITDKRGRSPLTLATLLNFSQCIELFKKHVSSDYLEHQHKDELRKHRDQEETKRNDYIRTYGMV